MSRVQVLDHGYVDLVETWGSEERIIESARMSTAKGFEGWGPHCSKCGISMVVHDAGASPANYEKGSQKDCDHDAKRPGDEGLLRYLYANGHHTPFEMAGLTFEVQAPIFVVREWHRHRTQSYNELSARYTPIPDLNYVPTVERLMANAAGSNKQANRVGGAPPLTEKDAAEFQLALRDAFNMSQAIYEHFLFRGVPKELARAVLPVGRYTRMRASANLRNWLLFLKLRDDVNAQWEIQQYAKVVSAMIAQKFPRTHELYVEGRR